MKEVQRAEASKSEKIIELAKRYIPGGVNSSMRAQQPFLAYARAKGSKIYDADGNAYADYHQAFGPIILGHCNDEVNAAVHETIETLDLLGTGVTELEAQLAEKLVQHFSSADKVYLCASGTEATFHAIRLARAATGKKKLVKFQGCYHGQHDYTAMNVITPAEMVGRKHMISAGVLPEVADQTLVLTFNSLEEVEAAARLHRGELAAVIMELIPHNVGAILPDHDFIKGVREVCDREGIVLIFDEVITGFRHGLSGYQGHCNVSPDVTTVGKSMANGYPISGILGREDLMERYAPAGGDVFLSGTFYGHPLVCAASLATVRELERPGFYDRLFSLGERARRGLTRTAEELRVQAFTTGFGSVFTTYFMDPPVRSYSDLLRNDKLAYEEYRRRMVSRGHYLLPLNLKRASVSASHTEGEVDSMLEATAEVWSELKKEGILQPAIG